MFIKLLALFLFTNGGSNVQIQNVSLGQPQTLHQERCPAPQEKLHLEPHAGRDPAVTGALLSPTPRVHESLYRGERQTCLGVLPQ